ncbi:DNA-directed RNA polymerase V subunit 1 [Vitis vinifera]|uniref:DNA-directed RNA polymerase n=1 Tax=Vitis vinifera TaxID=29760 RepID=A0A438GAW0_VITVI|nr:DNA-directed RNA polymerase V subunit 1 [Vitis vinifera]
MGISCNTLPVPPNCLSVPDISDGVSIMSSDLSVSMLKKVLKQIEVIKGSRSGEPNFESHKIEANNLQSSIEQYLEVRGTAKTSRSLDTRFGSSKEPNESSTKAWLEKMRTLFIRKVSWAKAEVLELFSVEKQLLSSHSGNLNLQLATDSLLSLKVLFERYFLNKAAAQQLVMFVSMSLPRPALLKSPCSGPCWTALQILQTALPSYFDCIGERHWISKSAILKVDYNRDVLQSLVNEIVTSIFSEKGPNEVLKFFDSLQPLLMENLFSEGFSVSLEDFSIPSELQAENHLRLTKVLLLISFEFICTGTLVEGMAYLFKSKYPFHGADYPSGEFGLIRSCFFHGLDPYEEMVHSIHKRNNLRNVCSNSIIQFELCQILHTKAVLDSSPSSNSSWELMKKNAAYLVKNQLKKASLKDTAVEFMIEYVKQHAVSGSSEPGTGLVGHIHLNKVVTIAVFEQLLLQDLNVSMQEVCQKCEETINSFRKKKNVGPFFKKIILSFSLIVSDMLAGAFVGKLIREVWDLALIHFG